MTGDGDDDLLVAVLDEVIYLLDTTGEAPVDVNLSQADSGVDMTFAMVDATRFPRREPCQRQCHSMIFTCRRASTAGDAR